MKIIWSVIKKYFSELWLFAWANIVVVLGMFKKENLSKYWQIIIWLVLIIVTRFCSSVLYLYPAISTAFDLAHTVAWFLPLILLLSSGSRAVPWIESLLPATVFYFMTATISYITTSVIKWINGGSFSRVILDLIFWLAFLIIIFAFYRWLDGMRNRSKLV